MRREDRLRRDPVVAEESVRRFELGVVERLREARVRSLRDQVGEDPEPPVQPVVAQLGAAELLG